MSWVRGDAVLLAEANVDADEIPRYFGDGDRMHMLFNFIADQYLFLALADQRREPLDHALRSLPALPPGGQWLNFLRNHDELDLGRSDAGGARAGGRGVRARSGHVDLRARRAPPPGAHARRRRAAARSSRTACC